ncbi:type I restriction endonuclease [Vibrio sp. MACH09]|uniref:restriction endonuclease subunit S n=1 Tax=Vibrio sp. MACH09 TaxID=3025122 RepID=UPI002794EED9|nr:restriction endonuclease subunit S [Vibrio sp. MACH09]GLO60572.1 type I restriction endonuclease [Vibrio sp. MACH09]
MKSIVPSIRFQEFDGDWDYSKLSERMTIFRGASPRPKGDPRFYGGNIPRLMIQDVSRDGKYAYPCIDFLTEEGAKKSRLLKAGSLVLSCSGTRVAIPGILGIDACIHDGWLSFKDYKEVNTEFLYNQFERLHEKIQGSATKGGVFNNLTTEIIKSMKMGFPAPEEQQKIANFLSNVDKKIVLLKEKHSLLVQYNKGVMQKLFSQEIRFKDEDGNNFPEWVKYTLGDLSNKISNKNKDESVTNVLTNSAKSGIVSQTDYFKKDIANQSNLGGYSIVEKNDFVYNPRISELAPVGPIKRNHVGQGVMSPLYTVFRFKDESVLDYLELYFETTQWHRYMNSIANFGARHDRMNITMGDFFNLPIPIPSENEMVKIVEFIQSLNKKVELVSQQLEHTQTFKKGLLQQMFV